MVKESLLDAYRKLNLLKRKIYSDSYHEKLKKRLDFYEQEGMTNEYFQTYHAIQEFEQLIYSINSALDKPGQLGSKFTWQDYFKRADQLLYGESYPQWALPDYYGTNDKLLSLAVEELNKKFPSDDWQLGDLPLYRWNTLNYPGYEATESEIQSWKNNPNISESDGYFVEGSVKHIKCIYSSDAKSTLTQAEGNMKKLREACNAIKKAKQAYVVEDDVLIDHECSGGYDLGLELVFSDNATTTFYGTELTPVEQVINSTIVKEIDTRLAGTEDMRILHERLNNLSDKVNSFLSKHGFLKSGNATPTDINPNDEPSL